MALSPQLLNFKSSGVYRLEFDKSQTANINVETLRLVVGSSRKGPYNTPVLIDSQETFNNVFGSIDKGLEKKGMFFHRSCLEALSRGPILALNLGKFESGDIANYQSLSTTGSVEGNSSVDGSGDYDSFFDNDKFMTPSDDNTLTAISNGDNNLNNLLNFVNIKQDSITIIVRQAQDVAEFNMTAREWYGEGNVPEYLNQFDRMSDFMMDVFVFRGEFDASAMASDPIYSAYFDADGLIKSKLNEFANLRQVSLIAQYTGSILPGFKDLEGRNLYIESMINAEARRTGLFCAVDEDTVIDEDGTKVDFVGHIVDADQDFELLSHVVGQTVTVEHQINLSDASVVAVSGDTLNVTNVVDPGNTSDIEVNIDFLESSVTGEYVGVTAFTGWSEDIAAVPDAYNQTAAPGTVTIANVDSINLPSTGVVELTPTLGTAIDLGGLAIGDWLFGGTGVVNAELTAISGWATVGTPAIDEVITLTFTSGLDSSVITDFANGDPTDVFTDDGFVAGTPAYGSFSITCEDDISTSYNQTVSGSDILDILHVTNGRVIAEDFSSYGAGGTVGHTAGNTDFTVTFAYGDEPATFPISIGDYVQSATTTPTNRITRVNRVAKALLPDSTNPTSVEYTVHTGIEPAYDDQIIKSFENASNHYKTFVLEKANITVKTISDYLSVLTGGNGLYDALIDKDIIDFRYIVDTFTSYDLNGLNTKSNLSQLAKDRQNASAILNAPTVADFKASDDPSFKDENGIFNTAYIASGGNQDLNPTKTYTLPSINAGANYAFYYGPGLIVSDNGKDIIVPPAAYVSNNYLDKYTNALPWSIVAGPRRGVVSGTNVKGVEYSFDKNDRDVLEPFGINPIVFQRGIGLTILGNKTAQQSIKSALSSAHVREALIYIEDAMADILKDYVFEFNNTQTRLEIKTLADSLMEGIKQDGGVYDYKNVMDTTNNTNEVIDNNMGIIDTYVEPVKGLEIVVHRTTILNTGEIQSGNLG